MTVTVYAKNVSGTVSAIPSKSAAHRILILSALADAPTKVICPKISEDIEATVGALRALGADIQKLTDGYLVTPGRLPENSLLDCGESGSTLRFLLPVAAALGANAQFIGRGRLPLRPMGDLAAAIEQGGGTVSNGGQLPFTLCGKLHAGEYTVKGNVSSQYLTGLLMALPLLEGDSVIKVEGELQSVGYVDMTLAALELFGVEICQKDGHFYISGGKSYHTPGEITVEGDYSNAAFFLSLGALSEGGVTVTGLLPDSVQGDRAVLEVLKRFGADVKQDGSCVFVGKKALQGMVIDAKNIPDLVPVLAVVAAYAEGKTQFIGAERLRVKESDRIQTTVKLINSLGGKAEETADGLIVYGAGLSGGKVFGEGDHRIVMSAAVASVMGEVVIEGAEAVAKSYPGFFEDLKKVVR